MPSCLRSPMPGTFPKSRCLCVLPHSVGVRNTVVGADDYRGESVDCWAARQRRRGESDNGKRWLAPGPASSCGVSPAEESRRQLLDLVATGMAGRAVGACIVRVDNVFGGVPVGEVVGLRRDDTGAIHIRGAGSHRGGATGARRQREYGHADRAGHDDRFHLLRLSVIHRRTSVFRHRRTHQCIGRVGPLFRGPSPGQGVRGNRQAVGDGC